MADVQLESATSAAPVTLRRPVPVDLDKYVEKPHLPRALAAVTMETPTGTPGHDHQNLTVLQQHAAFFDRNKDGLVYPWETYAGFRALGFNFLISLAAAIVINGTMSYMTLDGWLPSPFFVIVIRNIHKAKHASDSEVYDSEGRFQPEKFEEIFSKFDREHKGGLTFWELMEMTEALRDAVDPFGWTASKLEWGFTYLLAAKGGLISKNAIRGVLDGSLFEMIELRRRRKKALE
ncbi:hypothetical protein CBR_g27762 [Chara braunii]|uniref:EF-hand domain-containing protein n=1 Tax=Chara braunii TaxID=69332 RepID=A0A388L8B4_CHABU|nr:hypothetical protein CBR_g27762 [Chara braunii]|eukprot:GBG78537.1 hypothetical protein CBR_g27762 [Chara braunii]